MTLQEVKSAHWQFSINNPGAVVEGVDDINQCLLLILLTAKGSDPLRPNFGCDILQHLDAPINQAVPNLVKSMLAAIEVWEKRVIVKKITHKLEAETIKFNIEWQFSVGFLAGDFDVAVGIFDKKLQSSYYSSPLDKIQKVLGTESGDYLTTETEQLLEI